ncbi:MAG: hypothetical protein LBC68_08495 [Prevotellaceae bacterium]|jgi:hypothetical protein|nr:hypothetical protein [Prevotellaceae bacterium]
MKTIKLIAFALFSFAVLNSCTVNDNNSERWYNEVIEVGEWTLVGDPNEIGSYYESIWDGFPYIDGVINVYMYQDYGTNKEIQIPLPYTFYGIDVDPITKEEYHYSIQYSYDIAIDGSIAFKIHVSDYITNTIPILREFFRVVIVYKKI